MHIRINTSKIKHVAKKTIDVFSANKKRFEVIADLKLSTQQSKRWYCLSKETKQDVCNIVFSAKQRNTSNVMNLLREHTDIFFNITALTDYKDIFTDIEKYPEMLAIISNPKHYQTFKDLSRAKKSELHLALIDESTDENNKRMIDDIMQNFECWSYKPILSDEQRRIRMREQTMHANNNGQKITGTYLPVKAIDQNAAGKTIHQVTEKELTETIKNFIKPIPLHISKGLKHITGAHRNYLNQLMCAIFKGQDGYAPLQAFIQKEPKFMQAAAQIITYIAAIAEHEYQHNTPIQDSKLAELMLIIENTCDACADHAGLGLMRLYIYTLFDNTLNSKIPNAEKLDNILNQVTYNGVMANIEKIIPNILDGMPKESEAMAAEASIKAYVLAMDIYGLKSPFESMKAFNYSEFIKINPQDLMSVVHNNCGNKTEFIKMLYADKNFRIFMQNNHPDKFEFIQNLEKQNELNANQDVEVMMWENRLEQFNNKNPAHLTKKDGEIMTILKINISNKREELMMQNIMPTIVEVFENILPHYGLNMQNYLVKPK
jgi:hypothetical protein